MTLSVNKGDFLDNEESAFSGVFGVLKAVKNIFKAETFLDYILLTTIVVLGFVVLLVSAWLFSRSRKIKHIDKQNVEEEKKMKLAQSLKPDGDEQTQAAFLNTGRRTMNMDMEVKKESNSHDLDSGNVLQSRIENNRNKEDRELVGLNIEKVERKINIPEEIESEEKEDVTINLDDNIAIDDNLTLSEISTKTTIHQADIKEESAVPVYDVRSSSPVVKPQISSVEGKEIEDIDDDIEPANKSGELGKERVTMAEISQNGKSSKDDDKIDDEQVGDENLHGTQSDPTEEEVVSDEDLNEGRMTMAQISQAAKSDKNVDVEEEDNNTTESKDMDGDNDDVDNLQSDISSEEVGDSGSEERMTMAQISQDGNVHDEEGSTDSTNDDDSLNNEEVLKSLDEGEKTTDEILSVNTEDVDVHNTESEGGSVYDEQSDSFEVEPVQKGVEKTEPITDVDPEDVEVEKAPTRRKYLEDISLESRF